MKPPEDLIRQLPDLESLGKELKDPQQFIARAFPAEEPPLSGLPGPQLEAAGAEPELAEFTEPITRERERVVELGASAVDEIRRQGPAADLSPGQILALEAIVVISGRPAILIQDDRFFPPPASWEALEQARDAIEKTCRSVGRIEVTGHPQLDWIGTGFLVADDVIMTNRHVAKEFCHMGPRRRWSFEPGMTARIDFVEQLGGLTSAEYALTAVIGVHDLYDMALFRMEPTASQGLTAPEPLALAATPPSPLANRKVYTVGYPAWDGRRNDPEVMQRLFSNIYNVKRLQPGEMTRHLPEKALFQHDCSTLGGNSGSCVVDLTTNRVLGLHFGGRYRVGNQAVALWHLTQDPLLKKARVNFA